MVFKPFKPPLIRKAPESSDEKLSSGAAVADGADDDATPPTKKPRLGEISGVDGERKPLVQVKNSGVRDHGSESVSEDNPERYFNALWYDLSPLLSLWRFILTGYQAQIHNQEE